MTSNIGKSNCHVGYLNSEGKTIKPTISNLSQNTHLRRLRATLNFGWQAPEGILEPGLHALFFFRLKAFKKLIVEESFFGFRCHGSQYN